MTDLTAHPAPTDQKGRSAGVAGLVRGAAVLVACVMAVSAIALSGGSASAAASAGAVSLKATSLKVWHDDCGDARYTLAVDDSWTDWDARVRVYKPGGRIAETETMQDGESTTRKVLLCTGYDRFGEYDVTVSVRRFNDAREVVETANARTTFTFGLRPKDRTRISLRTTHVRHGVWKFSGVLTRKGNPYRDERVAAQVLVSGVWFDLKTKRTGHAGMVRFRARPKPEARRYPLRLYFEGSNETKRAASRTFRIYP